MEYCRLEQISEQMEGQLRAGNLYPVLGAGFSANCKSRGGIVPDGKKLKEDFLSQIKEQAVDIENIKDRDLKQVSKYYKEMVPRDVRVKYLMDKLTGVSLEKEKKRFLDINWKYVYTFNIDTAIEDNSIYKNVILPNKPGDEKTIETLGSGLFKVHGDVVDYCKYKNSECYIFDSKEYARNIDDNKFILNKMKHDFTFNNLIFVGCSLSEELDLLSMNIPDTEMFKASRYYITSTKPDRFREIDLETYGITHIVLVTSYEDFYKKMYDIYIKSLEMQKDELDDFKNPKIEIGEMDISLNKDYFYFGKKLFDKQNQRIHFPGFFIQRSVILNSLLPEMDKYSVQFLCGGRVSGKSYALASIPKIIRDRNVYIFDSRYTISRQSLEELMKKNNSVICFDTSTLPKDIIFQIKDNAQLLYDRNINFVIAVNRSDKDIIASIKKLSMGNKVAYYELENILDDCELENLNKNLGRISIPIFHSRKTILDNILMATRDSTIQYNKYRDAFEVKNIYEMMILILLAINEKISSQEFVDFNIERDIYDLLSKLSPIIDEDYTSSIERDTLNSSSYKVYANSKYWILRKLGGYATDPKKHKLIIEAYHKIIEKLLINHGSNYKDLEDYIKYDVINEIFFRPQSGNLTLIKNLYDDLDDLLYSEPQFFHQKAKCYLWHCDYSNDKKNEINEALRYVKLAKHNLEIQGNRENEKVKIALAHIDFTIALIYAKINNIMEYKDFDRFKEGIKYISEGIKNKTNEDYFYGLLKRNNKKVNDVIEFYKYVVTNNLDIYNLTAIERKNVDEFVTFMFKAQNNEN